MSDVLNQLEEINAAAKQNPNHFIRRAETRYDELLNRTVARVCGGGAQIVLLAGPSASGKTTTARKISQKLAASGHTAYSVSLDDFYKNRNEIAMGEDGKPDYETITALELELLSQVMNDLADHGRGSLPQYDFEAGVRHDDVSEIRLEPGDIVIFEGLHALNPIVSERLPQYAALKLYVSVSTRIYRSDGAVQMTKRDLRLVRRMIRDYRCRDSSVEHPFSLWGTVLKGEGQYLLPYKFNADLIIDSIHNYEPCVLRHEALRLLNAVPESSEWFSEAARLRKALEPFKSLPPTMVPPDSLLREFLG